MSRKRCMCLMLCAAWVSRRWWAVESRRVAQIAPSCHSDIVSNGCTTSRSSVDTCGECWDQEERVAEEKKNLVQTLANSSLQFSYGQIFQELKCATRNDLEIYIRMPMSSFLFILERIAPYIQKEETLMRDAISPGARLEACLIFLASEQSYSRLQFSTRISPSSLSILIPETCQAIYDALKLEYMKVCNYSKIPCIEKFISELTKLMQHVQSIN